MAQAVPDVETPPGVVVLKHNWSKSASSGSAPFSIPIGNSQDRIVLPDSVSARDRSPVYLYSMEIRNSGANAIKALTWDYIFDEPISKRELGRITLGNFEKIDTHSKKLLQVRSRSSPPRVVTATGLAKDLRSPFDEHVSIMCVLYKDGTVWEHPDATGTACEELRQWLIRRGKLKA
jgi:hypothetical protein